MIDKKAIATRIKKIRLEKGMTMEEFGELLNTSKSSVSMWEKGRSLPNKERLKAIADLGNMTVEELLQTPKKIIDKEKFRKVIERYNVEPIKENAFNNLVEALNQTINIIEYDIGDYVTMYSYNYNNEHRIKDLKGVYEYFVSRYNALDEFLNTLDINNPNNKDIIMDLTIELGLIEYNKNILKEYVKEEAE